MLDATSWLNGCIGYTQSDEITIIVKPTEKAHDYMFGGKCSKLNSVIASRVTACFNKHINSAELAYFDCRVWGVPTAIEASNVLLWRVLDAERNAVSAAYHHMFGHKAMQGKSCKEMLNEIGLTWETLPERQKLGMLSKGSSRAFRQADLQDRLTYLGDTI